MKSRCALLAVVAALAAPMADADAQRPSIPPGQRPAVAAPATSSATDVRATVNRMLQQQTAPQGRNLVHTAPSGAQLWLINTNGRVTGWEVTDRNGKSLPVRYVRNPANPQSQPGGAARAVQVKCSVCTEIHTDKGIEVTCWVVDCDKIPVPQVQGTAVPAAGTRPISPLVGQGAATSQLAAAATDLRPALGRLAQQNLIGSGKRLVHTGSDGVKLSLVAVNGRVTGWEAVDRDGKPLEVRYHETAASARSAKSCRVCVWADIDGKNVQLHCYEVDCDKLPKPPANLK